MKEAIVHSPPPHSIPAFAYKTSSKEATLVNNLIVFLKPKSCLKIESPKELVEIQDYSQSQLKRIQKLQIDKIIYEFVIK